jgi:hypothetical protein
LPRVIVKAFDIKISPNHCQSEENHPGASLPRPAESKLNAAGIISALSDFTGHEKHALSPIIAQPGVGEPSRPQ